MRIGLICRPVSFHGGIETATAGRLGAFPLGFVEDRRPSRSAPWRSAAEER